MTPHRRVAVHRPLAWATAPFLLAGFAVAVWLRTAVGGPAVASSAPAGLAFAAALVALTIAAGPNARVPRARAPSIRAVGWGVFGAAVLCAPPLLHAGLRAGLDAGSGHPPAGPYLPWAAVVTVVAIAEEAFLRGALFDAVSSLFAGPGTAAALAITSLCFAAVHVPLYGWHTLPLNLAAGLWLGALRQAAGQWTAPAIAHVLADLTSWWLR